MSLFPFFDHWPSAWRIGRSAVAAQLLLLGSLTALAQAPAITTLSPTRNLRNAAASTNVAVTFSQPMQNLASTQQAVRVFSQQRGGRMFGTTGGTASVSGATVTFNPTTNFKPGETVFVTTTTGARSAVNGLPLARPSVHQFTVATGGTGTGSFVAPITNAEFGASQPSDVALADVDGDGDLDLLAASNRSNVVRVGINNGAGSFTASQLLSVPASGSITAGDVDGDGDLDMLASDNDNGAVNVYVNNGTGTFSFAQNVVTGTTPYTMVLGDVDGDGDLDFLVPNFGSNTVSVRLNNGAGSFSGSQNVSVGAGPADLDLGDVDGDGDLDLMVANANGASVSVRFNDGAGNFSGSQTVNNAGSNKITLGDVDGDGDLDMLSTRNFSVYVSLNNGSGSFGLAQTLNLASNPQRIRLGDVDADGDIDMLIMNSSLLSAASVSVLLNDGAGTFSNSQLVTVGVAGADLVLGDLDGDGDLDMVTANSGSSSVSVRLNAGAPTLTNLSPTTGIIGASVTLTGTDFTGATAVSFNGTPATSFTVNSATSITATVPVGATTGPVTVTTSVGTSNGRTFTVTPLTITALSPVRNLRNALTSANIGVTFSQSMQNTTATQQAVQVFSQQRGGLMFGTTRGVANVTGNTIIFNPTNSFKPGETVFVTTTTAATATGGATLARGHVHQITVAAGGTGRGIFAAPVTGSNSSVGHTPSSVTVGDVDGDGDVDLLTANYISNTVSVRLNNGSGSFSGGSSPAVGDGPSGVAVGDVDGDGDLDLLTANRLSNTVSVRLNNGSGSFSGGSSPAVGNSPGSVVVGDVDGDGDLDLLTANRLSNTVSVRLNDGSGSFSGGSNPGVGLGPRSVAVGDVDGDGDLDLLTANYNGNTVSVRLNDGSGNFTAPASPINPNPGISQNPISVVLGDVDGDGDLDFLTANYNGNTVSVRLNDGTGNFTVPATNPNPAVGDGPYIVAVADVDGDGDLDFLTPNYSDNTVSVRLNDGTGNFVAPATNPNPAVGAAPTSVALGDVDNDGDLDFLAANSNVHNVSIRLNFAAPSLFSLTPTSGIEGASIVISGANLTGATAVSFNGTPATSFTVNSASQIAVTVPAGATTGNVTVTTPGGTSNGVTFTVSLAITTLSPARNLRNAAASSSVAVTFDQPMQNVAATQQAVQVFSQQRGGRMSGTQGGTATVSGNTITFDPATDFKPGETVLVTTTTAATATSGAALARSHIHQFTTATGGTGTGTFSGGSNLALGNSANSVAVGDVDGDGDLDMLTSVANTVVVRRNDGTGSFGNAGAGSVSASSALWLAMGDLDGDGDLDFVATNYLSGTGTTVNVRLNDGTGTFSSAPSVSVGSGPFRVTLGDLDGDGDLDMITANTNALSTFSVRRNDGAGNFSAIQNIAANAGGRGLKLGDVDGDGDLDLVSSHTNSSTVTVRFNNGTGSFGGAQNVTVGAEPRGISLGDVDGDGDLDLLVANSGSNTLSVRANNGVGVFSGGSTLTVGSNPWNVELGDLDADGDLDVVSSSDGNATIGVCINDGTGNFSVSNWGVGSGPRGLALGDLDGDGDLDVATSNLSSSSSLSVRFNNNAPTALSLSSSTVAENAGANAAIGTFSTTDANAGDTFTYSLVTGTGSTDNAAFAISGNTLQLLASADFEVKNSYAIRVRTTDQSGGSFDQPFTISITNVNEAPSISPQTLSVAENSANGTVVGTVVAADPDAGTTLTYTITAGNTGGAFTLVGNSLRVANTAALDFETTPTFTLTVEVSDGTLTASNTVTVNLTDVLEAVSLTVSTPQTIPAGLYSDITVTGTGVATLGGAVVVNGPFVVQTGGVLNTACQSITGTGTFTLEASATLSICSPQGISLFGTTGDVQLSGARSYSPEATYRYVGSSPQQTGNGLSRASELEIANTAGVTLSRAVEIEQILRLTSGTLVTNDQLTLRSSATRQAYAVHAGGSSSGSVTVQRFVDGPTTAGYRHLSSPVQASTVADLQTSGFTPRVNSAYNALPYVPVPAAQFPTVFGYNENRGGTNAAYAGFNTGYYSPTALTDVLTRGRGWTVYLPGGKTPDFEGPLTTGNVALSLSVTGTNTSPDDQKAGWHLLGNPYPQPIDWDLVTVGNGAGQTPTTMSNAISVYRTLGGGDGLYLARANGIGSLPDGLLAVGQGFFVRALAASTFTFTNALRVEANPDPVARTTDVRPQVALTLQAAGASTPDAAYVYFEAGATAGLDARYDAARPGQNAGSVPTLSALTSTGEAVVIDGLPAALLSHGTTVELALALPTTGIYQFGVADLRNLSGTPVTLVDRLTGTRYDMAQVPTITFRASAGQLTGRFALEFGARVLGTAAEVEAAPALAVHPNPATGAGAVRISGCGARESVALYDVTGRLMAEVTADAAGEGRVEVAGWPAGVYVLRTRSGRTTRLVME